MEAQYVGAGSVEHRVGDGVSSEVLPHEFLEPSGVHVLPVGNLVAFIGGCQRGEYLGMHAGVVVRREAAYLGIVETGGSGDGVSHWSIISYREAGEVVRTRG